MIRIIKQYLNKGKTQSHLLKTFLVYGFIALSIIIIKIFIARFYGQEELGIFTYFFNLVSFMFLFTSFGLPDAITQTISKEPSKLKSILKYYISCISTTTIFFATVILLFTFYTDLNPNLPYFNVAIIMYLISHTFFYTAYSIMRGFKEFVKASTYYLINRIIFIVFIVIAFILSLKFINVLVSMSLALLITTPIILPQIKKLMSKDSINAPLKKFLYLAFSLFLMQLSFQSLRFVDALSIKYVVDLTSLGLYSAHSSVTNVIRTVAYVFPIVILPMAVTSKYKIKKSLNKILLVLIPFSFFVLIAAYFVVPLFYGSEYKNIGLPIALVISSSFLILYSYFNSIFIGENNFSGVYLKILFVDVFLSLFLNTGLNILFINYWGIIGAPIATATTIVLKILLNLYGIKKLRRKKLLYEIKKINT